MVMSRYIPPSGYRMMDRAWLRDGATIHTGEALLLALLLHTKGKTKRGQDEIEHVARLMKDPNRKNRRSK
jgi:hypothetical protein